MKPPIEMHTLEDVYAALARYRPTEWWMTESQALELSALAVRKPIREARVRRGAQGEPPIVIEDAIYHDDEYYREQTRRAFWAGDIKLLGRPVRPLVYPG